MGKKTVLTLFFVLSLFFVAYPGNAIEDLNIYSVNALFTVYQNNSVYEAINYSFSLAVNKSILYPINKNITDLYISDGNNDLNYTIIDNENNYLINISFNDSLTKLSIKYTSINTIFQKDLISFFYTDFNFNNPVNKIEVKVNLPVGFSVYNSEYSPKEATISSDGGNIALIWRDTNLIKSISYSVRFHDANIQIVENNSTSNTTSVQVDEKFLESLIKKVLPFFLGIPVLIIIIIIASVLIFVRRVKHRAKQDFLKGFMEDEQKVILYLQKNKQVWQSKIRKEFNFSRAKTTRIIKKLEDKALVKKEEFGKTNKISWFK